MTRAKDISKILTDADFSGTLDVTGAVTASGLTVEGSTAPTINIKSTDAVVVADDVVGAITFEESDSTGGTGVQAFIKAIANDSGNTYDMSIGVGGNTEAIRVDQSGNLGIGLSSPQELLHLKDGSIAVGNGTASNNTVIGRIGFSTDSSNSRFIGIESFRGGDAANADLRFHTFGGDGNSGERMRISNSGNVGIGTSSPDTNLDVEGAGDCTISITANSTSHDSKIDFVQGSTIEGGITYDHNGSYASEKLILRAGNNGSHIFLDGNGTTTINTQFTNVVSVDARHGIVLSHNTTNAATGVCQFSANGHSTIIQNRDSDDGNLTVFRQNANQEGTISVSGSTVSYNSFSGSHWSRLSNNSKPTILKGTVIETIDEMCDWYQAQFDIQEEGETRRVKQSIALPSDASVGDTLTVSFEGNDYTATIVREADNKHTKCKISDTADSTRVYGVYSAWDNEDDTVNDMYVTAVGTHVVRVHSSATVSAGDLLVSNGDGTAKVQDDDIIRSKTIGKVLTNIVQETYDDGSYTVPCALYCG